MLTLHSALIAYRTFYVTQVAGTGAPPISAAGALGADMSMRISVASEAPLSGWIGAVGA